MDATGKVEIEAALGAHDVDALEGLRAVLVENRDVLRGVLGGAGGAVLVADAAVPGRRRRGLVGCAGPWVQGSKFCTQDVL